MKASEFKARCLKLMDEVKATGEEIVITKNGEPVARLVPHRPANTLFGLMSGSVVILGDVVGPSESAPEPPK